MTEYKSVVFLVEFKFSVYLSTTNQFLFSSLARRAWLFPN
jgi:hypothetical protein